MKKLIITLTLLVAAAGGYWYSRGGSASPAAGAAGRAGGPGGAGAFTRAPMTVELGAPSRGTMSEVVTVVGNLEGQATVDVASKVSGRLEEVLVRIGDRVSKGQKLGSVENREIQEQVRQAEASFDVARATVRQREADLKFAETNLERSRSLFQRQLLPRQSMDDAEARQMSASAQVDLARAQFEQARARLDELKIMLSNAEIRSPVTGFVGRRLLDPGSSVSSNTPIVSVVEIDRVRLVANIVERDLRRVEVGSEAEVDVDAFPGEIFRGRVARVAPVLDPSTRTAQIEIEVPNPAYRLKPGMYSRVRLTVATKQNALTVPINAVVTIEGRRGIFTVQDGGSRSAKFSPVKTGMEDGRRVEVLEGLADGVRIVTTGAAALRDGDPVQLSGERPAGGGARTAGPRGAQSGRPAGAAPRPTS